ncbi:MAG: hypothetical protein ACRCXM_08340 [Beijerinckiaceae bacterium]
MSIYLYHLIEPATQRIFFVGASQRPSERYQEHLDGECADTAAQISAIVDQGAVPVMKIISEHATWKAADSAEKLARMRNALPQRAASVAQLSYPALAGMIVAQQGFATFMN